MNKFNKIINGSSLLFVLILLLTSNTKTDISTTIDSKEIATNIISKINIDEVPKTKTQEENINNSETTKTDILKSYTGKMSFYKSNCFDCSGITATGIDVRDERLFYNDNTYGKVRIVAAGSEIPLWSIIKIKNTSFGDILAIVLDRGASIGLGKAFLIDMLTNNIESKDGIESNITVEVLRTGND